MTARITLLLLSAALCSKASIIAFNGFETDTGDWTFALSGQAGDGNGSVTQTASGAGSLALPAFDGSFYATLHSNTNGAGPGLANGGSSFFGFDTVAPPYPGSAFSQAISVFINVNTPAPASPSTPAFLVDGSPSSTSPGDVGSGGVGLGGEHNFRLTYSGSSVGVTDDGGASLTTLTTSGWYVFQMIYSRSANPTDLATSTLNILNASSQVLGTDVLTDNANGDPLQSQFLAGPGFVSLTQWQNGFSDNLLGIDDVRADTVPEPREMGLMGVGILFLAGLGWRKRMAFTKH
jgi:hypothetical protein